MGIKLTPKTCGPKVVSGAEPIGLARPDQTQVQDHWLSPKGRIFRIYQNRLLSHPIWGKVPNRMTLAKESVISSLDSTTQFEFYEDKTQDYVIKDSDS